MPIYLVEMTWSHSVENLELDTTALPHSGAFVTTIERWEGETATHSYRAKVMSLAEDKASLSLVLRYDSQDNPGIPNESWGKSTITLRTAPGGPANSAIWKDDKPGSFDGKATIRVTQRPTPDEDIADELNGDFADIMDTTPETDKLTQILARIGQGTFRRSVTRAWNMGETCAVTQIDIPEMLIASHIRPWSESSAAQRIDPANGLLLAAHVDKLFDRHLLSFKQTGTDYVLALHPRARQAAKRAGILPGTKLPVERLDAALRSRFAEYMREHHERFEQKIAAYKADLW